MAYTSQAPNRAYTPGVSTFRQAGYSTDPGREGDPALQAETPATTALLNERAALDAQAAQDAANAAAETARGQGNAAATAIRVQAGLDEAEAYRIAAGTAGSNADLEQQATAITAFQQARQVRSTLGAQMADVASAGFAAAGSNISLLRDSISQGAITDALTRLQGNINAGGYLAQQQAATAESDAARSASAAEAASGAGESQASQLLAQQYAAAGVLATSQSANLAAALAANPADATTRYTSGRGGVTVAGSGGVTGFSARPSRGDPFLEGSLVNPAYTGLNPFAGENEGYVAPVVPPPAVHSFGETSANTTPAAATGNTTPAAAQPTFTTAPGTTDAERFFTNADTEAVE